MATEVRAKPSPRPACPARRALLLGGVLALAGCVAGPRGSGAPLGDSALGQGSGATLHVMTSGGFTAAYLALAPGFEALSGHRLRTAFGASQGGAGDSIAARLARNEPAGLVIMARPALDALVALGQVVAGSQVDLVRSPIAFAVRQGTPKPDISTVDALRSTLLAAPSIAYSASASGTYFETELLKSLGVEAQVKPKSRRILSERVGAVVARGEAALGLQQLSELLPIPGIDIVGVLPAPVQRVTVFSAGITRAARHPQAARALQAFLAGPDAHAEIRRSGLEPVSAR